MAGSGANGGSQGDMAQLQEGGNDGNDTETEQENIVKDNDTQQVMGGLGGNQASGLMGGEPMTDQVDK